MRREGEGRLTGVVGSGEAGGEGVGCCGGGLGFVVELYGRDVGVFGYSAHVRGVELEGGDGGGFAGLLV